jgi:hypothetical protein
MRTLGRTTSPGPQLPCLLPAVIADLGLRFLVSEAFLLRRRQPVSIAADLPPWPSPFHRVVVRQGRPPTPSVSAGSHAPFTIPLVTSRPKTGVFAFVVPRSNQQLRG